MKVEQLKKFFMRIAGQWDGDLPGAKEDHAHLANEGLDHVERVEEIFNKLK